MLWKFQKKTLIAKQVIAYCFTLFIGICIFIAPIQLLLDLSPILVKGSNKINEKYTVVNKKVSIFKTIEKEKIYFSPKELNDLEKQVFVKEVSKVNSARFKVSAKLPFGHSSNSFYTDLFFESIPNKYVNTTSDEWKWDSTKNFIPIMVPENYLNLYNFGFAETQGLPVFSKNTVSKVVLNIQITGDRASNKYRGRIVDFTNKMNSILGPEEFLLWANKKYSGFKQSKTSRLLVEFNPTYNEEIIEYLNNNNYNAKQEMLELNKLQVFLKTIIIYIIAIGGVIIIISIILIILSISLVLQKNKKAISTLFNIGYNYKEIAMFYQIIISSATTITIALSLLSLSLFRNNYLTKIESLFGAISSRNYLLIFGFFISCVLILINFITISSSVKKTIKI